MISKSFVKGTEVAYAERKTSDLVFVDAGARIGEIFGSVPGTGTFFSTNSGCLTIDKLGVTESFGKVWSPYPFDIPERDWSTAEIHLFEPNDDYHSDLFVLAKRLSNYCVSTTVHTSAVWINKEVKFFHVYDTGLGSTLLNREGNKEETKMINCVSFKSFLLELPGNDIHVKMDIEGSEYDVLGDVLTNAICLNKLSSLSIEWHRDIFPEMATKFWRYRGQHMIGAMKAGVMINWWPGEF